MFIEKRADKATPSRVIAAAVKRHLDVPDHLGVRAGLIADLEAALS
jgi:hypothetical protein